jgi:AbrB family looped-hinge helix DNA binding protein
MDAITVSSKYQVVIPLKVRKMLGIQRGQKMQVIAYDNRVVLIPVRPIQEARGSLRGMDTNIEREEDREL